MIPQTLIFQKIQQMILEILNFQATQMILETPNFQVTRMILETPNFQATQMILETPNFQVTRMILEILKLGMPLSLQDMSSNKIQQKEK